MSHPLLFDSGADLSAEQHHKLRHTTPLLSARSEQPDLTVEEFLTFLIHLTRVSCKQLKPSSDAPPYTITYPITCTADTSVTPCFTFTLHIHPDDPDSDQRTPPTFGIKIPRYCHHQTYFCILGNNEKFTRYISKPSMSDVTH
jgi:hypothetical protein